MKVERMALHKLQFAISRESTPPIASWRSMPMVNGWWLHSCPMLLVKAASTVDGRAVVLLGWAFQLGDGDDPESQLSTLFSKDLVAKYYTWTGRWVLILDDCVHGDATNSIPIFYGCGLVSSSLCLLRQMSGANLKGQGRIVYGLGVDWYPGPTTRLSQIARLLASQTLSLATFRPKHRPLLVAISDQDPLQSFRKALTTGMCHIGARPEAAFLPLTGGLDSRTVLASAYASGMRPVAYTQEHNDLSVGDRLLPPELAARLGLPHKFIPMLEYDSERQAIFDEHTMSQCIDADRIFYACGQWDDFPPGSLILRGGGFEFGRAYYYGKIPPGFDPTMADAAERLHELMYYPLTKISWSLVAALRKKQSSITEGLRAWLNWVAAHPEPDLDFRDRFYLEQRLGCWLATTEQALDLTGTTRIHISNSHYVFSLMNKATLSERQDGSFQKAANVALASGLASFPYNPSSRRRRIGSKVFGNMRRIFRSIKFLVEEPKIS